MRQATMGSCLALLLLQPMARADDSTAASETMPIYALDEIVVTGTRTKHHIDDAPVPTEVITREEIQATTTTSIAPVLAQIADIYVRRNDEFRLGASTVRMQGADPNKVAILLNGRRFRGGVDGVVDIRDIPAHIIERIEIIRGPASSLYGSDAMAGVINIITRTPTTTPTLHASVGTGNYGRFFAAASHGYRFGDLDYFLSAQHDEIEIAQVYGSFSAQFNGDAADAKQTRDNVFVDAAYRPAPAHRLTLLGDYTPVREGPRSNKQNLTTGLGWEWQIAPTTDLVLGISRYGFDRHNDLEGFQEDLEYDDWSGEGRLAQGVPFGLWEESHLLSVGLRSRAEAIDSQGQRFETTSGLIFDAGSVDKSAMLHSPFVQDEIAIGPGWTAVVGASVDVHEYFGAQASPRLSLSWRPHDRYRISGTVGRGYRAPSLLQLFSVDANNLQTCTLPRGAGEGICGYVILGNRDLDPETDLGATIQIETQPIDGLTANLGFFRHDFHNLIATTFVTNPFPELTGFAIRYENVGAALTQGIDLTLAVEPFKLVAWSTTHRVLLNLNYGYLDSRNNSDRPGESGKQLPFRPQHRFLPGVTYDKADYGFTGRFWGEYESTAFTDLVNAPDSVAASHWLWHGRLAVTPARSLAPSSLPSWLRPGYDGVSFFFEAVNLADEEFGPLTAMGRLAGRRTLLAGITYER